MSEYKALSLRKFKQRFHLTGKQVNILAFKHKIEIQQSGFLGDSVNHYKLVIYPETFKPPLVSEWASLSVSSRFQKVLAEAKRSTRSAIRLLFELPEPDRKSKEHRIETEMNTNLIEIRRALQELGRLTNE